MSELQVTRDEQEKARAGQGSAVSLHKKEMLWEALSTMCKEHIKIPVGFSFMVCFF